MALPRREPAGGAGPLGRGQEDHGAVARRRLQRHPSPPLDPAARPAPAPPPSGHRDEATLAGHGLRPASRGESAGGGAVGGAQLQRCGARRGAGSVPGRARAGAAHGPRRSTPGLLDRAGPRPRDRGYRPRAGPGARGRPRRGSDRPGLGHGAAPEVPPRGRARTPRPGPAGARHTSEGLRGPAPLRREGLARDGAPRAGAARAIAGRPGHGALRRQPAPPRASSAPWRRRRAAGFTPSASRTASPTTWRRPTCS